MWENFKKYWFIYLIGACLAGFLVYYVIDLNSDKVSSKNSDGSDVLASTSLGDVTSEEIYTEFEDYSDNLLYALYRNAVVSQSVETTSEMESEAKTFARNVKSNINSDATGATEINITSELASYGFLDADSLYDYYLITLKQQILDRDYIRDHFEDLEKKLDTAPRTVSILKMEVADPENLTEEESTKQADIEAEIEANGFASAAAVYSDDLDTASNDGFYGYIDSTTTDLDTAVVTAATELSKGEISDWITVTDATNGSTALYKVQVDEDDIKTLFESDDEDIADATLQAFLSADSTIEILAVTTVADKLDITFEDENVKNRIESFIAEQTKVDEEELEESDTDVEVSDENTSENQADENADPVVEEGEVVVSE